jgi:hypothetical protein
MLILQHSLGLLFLDFGIKYYFSDSPFFFGEFSVIKGEFRFDVERKKENKKRMGKK